MSNGITSWATARHQSWHEFRCPLFVGRNQIESNALRVVCLSVCVSVCECVSRKGGGGLVVDREKDDVIVIFDVFLYKKSEIQAIYVYAQESGHKAKKSSQLLYTDWAN